MEIQTITNAGITYSKPEVTLLHAAPLWLGEVAGRTAYNSFSKSEHQAIQEFPVTLNVEEDIENSDLLTSLAWVHHHHSVIEMCNLTYHIKGVSRGVLVEHSRHRIQSLTVQSTRYTMSSLLNAFTTADIFGKYHWFETVVLAMDMFATDSEYNKIEIRAIWDKLMYQKSVIGIDEMRRITVAKSSVPLINSGHTSCNDLFASLEAGKQKRNVGDAFKHIVTDNWKCDLVVTMNLRGLKNYFGLRDSGAAYFLMRELAKAMKQATPAKYLDLIVRSK